MLVRFVRSRRRKILRLSNRACCHGRLDNIGNVNSYLKRGRSLGRNSVVSTNGNSDSVEVSGRDGALNSDRGSHNRRGSQDGGSSSRGDAEKSLAYFQWGLRY